MKLRSQLVFAFLLLAVIPLAIIVLYSYATSLAAVRQAVITDARALAGDMERRMEVVKGDIAEQVTELGQLPLGALATPKDVERRKEVLARLEERIGNVGPFIEALEFVPAPPPPAAAPPGTPPTGEPPPPPVAGSHPPLPDLPEPPELPEPAVAPEVDPEVARVETGEGTLMLLPPGADEGSDWQLRWLPAKAPKEASAPPGPITEEDRKKEAGLEVAGVALTVADQLMRMGVDHMEQELESQRGQVSHGANGARAKAEELAAARKELAALESKRDVVRMIRAAVNVGKDFTEAERRAMQEKRRKNRLVFGRDFELTVKEQGELVGRLTCEVSAEEVLQRVLTRTERDRGEIPFAVDADGGLHVAEEGDRATLQGLEVTADKGDDGISVKNGKNDWVVVTREDSETGLRFGIARPIGSSLQQIRTTAARNFGFGLAMVGLAMVGILPIASRMTRHLQEVTDSADAIARGDLSTRVPVPRSHELGRLATAFNSMAREISESQRRLVEEERRRRERETEQKLLEADHARKSRELEEARNFQLSLLPKALPRSPSWELAVLMRTATEVGGDYYDFRVAEDGSLVVAIGDATGHGAAAGTMVTIVKALFTTLDHEVDLTGFLDRASHAIKRMDLPRMAMALTLARLRDGKLSVAPAGMPPALVHRAATGIVDELPTEGMPLGGVVGFDYDESSTQVAPGDTVLLMSDGFPELLDGNGEPVGYGRARELFAQCANGTPEEIVATLGRHADRVAGGRPPQDDVTFVVLRVKQA